VAAALLSPCELHFVPDGKEVTTMPIRSRSAKTGKYVALSYANKHPSTTVREVRKTVRIKRPKK
jgi:hypothetical protein